MALTQSTPTRVSFLGMNPLGLSMVYSLLNIPRYSVCIYDKNLSDSTHISALGGTFAQYPRDAAANAEYIICFAEICELQTLFFSQDTSVLEVLQNGCSLLLCSLIDYNFYAELEAHIYRLGRLDLLLVDSPASGNSINEIRGGIVIFAAGKREALNQSSSLLHDISKKWFVIPGHLGAASKVQLVNQMLVGIHVSAAAEAIALAIKAGLDAFEIYSIIKAVAGNSRIFEDRVPHMLEDNWTTGPALDSLTNDMGLIMSISRSLQFPLPLSGVVEQICIKGTAQGYDKDSDASLVRILHPEFPCLIQTSHSPGQFVDRLNKMKLQDNELSISKISMLGLCATSRGMAATLLRAGYVVQGCDVFHGVENGLLHNEGKFVAATSPIEAVRGTQVVIIMLQSAAQIDDVLFGQGNAIEGISDNTVIIISSTHPPSYILKLSNRLEHLGRGLSILDAPVSGCPTGAAHGTLTIMLSGDDSTVQNVQSPILAMSGDASNIKLLRGGVGAASYMTLINQLLAGIHLAGAAEAFSFAARLELDPNLVFDVLINTSAWSWMLENRGPQMLDADWTPFSTLSTFVKDMGTVIDEARRLKLFTPISSAATTLFLSGAAYGWAHEADAGIVRFWELLTGVSVANCVLEASKSCALATRC